MLYCFCFPPPITFQLLKRLYCLAYAFSLLQSHLFLSLTPNAQLSPTDHSLSTSTRPPSRLPPLLLLWSSTTTNCHLFLFPHYQGQRSIAFWNTISGTLSWQIIVWSIAIRYIVVQRLGKNESVHCSLGRPANWVTMAETSITTK